MQNEKISLKLTSFDEKSSYLTTNFIFHQNRTHLTKIDRISSKMTSFDQKCFPFPKKRLIPMEIGELLFFIIFSV